MAHKAQKCTRHAPGVSTSSCVKTSKGRAARDREEAPEVGSDRVTFRKVGRDQSEQTALTGHLQHRAGMLHVDAWAWGAQAELEPTNWPLLLRPMWEGDGGRGWRGVCCACWPTRSNLTGSAGVSCGPRPGILCCSALVCAIFPLPPCEAACYFLHPVRRRH